MDGTSGEVIATFIIDWPVLIFLGLVFGAWAPPTGWWRSRALLAGAIAAGVFTLTALASYAIAPDWMWMYFLDPDPVSWVVFVIPAAYAFTFLLGFWSAIALKPLGGQAIARAAVVSLILEAVVIGITWERYSEVGTAAEWSAGRANELFSLSPDGDARTIGLMGPVFLVVAVAAFVWARRPDASAADR
jgi:hypothetical protein